MFPVITSRGCADQRPRRRRRNVTRGGSLSPPLHRDCAIESFKDTYRQIYPQYRGRVVSVNADGPIDTDGFDPAGSFYYERDGVKRVYGFYFLGPEDISGEDAPLQQVFYLNGDFFSRGLYGANFKPEPKYDGTVGITQFESKPNINLVAKFPGVTFNVEKRIDSYDALGRPVNERFVIDSLRLVPGPDFGTRVRFTNPETNVTTAITWNARAFAECLGSSTSAQ